MKKNISNENCTRCSNCGFIYDREAKSCPKCNAPNDNGVLEEYIYESTEPVFNLND